MALSKQILLWIHVLFVSRSFEILCVSLRMWNFHPKMIGLLIEVHFSFQKLTTKYAHNNNFAVAVIVVVVVAVIGFFPSKSWKLACLFIVPNELKKKLNK